MIEFNPFHDKLLSVANLIDKGDQFLLTGDTRNAARSYTTAASTLLGLCRNFSGEVKTNMMMQCAELFFEAADYKQCISVLANLSSRVGGQLHAAASQRLQNPQAIKQLLQVHREKGEHEDCLNLLKEHVMLFEPVEVATMRADICGAMGNTELSSRFKADAVALR